jgi:hypothetical protein
VRKGDLRLNGNLKIPDCQDPDGVVHAHAPSSVRRGVAADSGALLPLNPTFSLPPPRSPRSEPAAQKRKRLNGGWSQMDRVRLCRLSQR